MKKNETDGGSNNNAVQCFSLMPISVVQSGPGAFGWPPENHRRCGGCFKATRVSFESISAVRGNLVCVRGTVVPSQRGLRAYVQSEIRSYSDPSKEDSTSKHLPQGRAATEPISGPNSKLQLSEMLKAPPRSTAQLFVRSSSCSCQ